MYYRLAQPHERPHKLLFGFLRDAFHDSEELAADTRKLQEAIKRGSCNASEWHPYSALASCEKCAR
jgi:hypothetical protein